MTSPEDISRPHHSPEDPWADVINMLNGSPDGGEESQDGTTVSLAEFRDQLGESDTWDLTTREVEIVGAEQDPNTTKSLTSLKASGLDPSRIYYPASETFVTIAEVFGADKVIFGEIETRAVEALRAAGYTVLEGDMHTTPLPDNQKAEMVYMRHMPPQSILTEVELVDRLMPGGYFVVDNQYGQADMVREAYSSLYEHTTAELSDIPVSEKLHVFQLRVDNT